jgi:hypothetical protein
MNKTYFDEHSRKDIKIFESDVFRSLSKYAKGAIHYNPLNPNRIDFNKYKSVVDQIKRI